MPGAPAGPSTSPTRPTTLTDINHDPGRKRLEAKKRDPKTKLEDEQLLALIRRDLETSPFSRESHRKMWPGLKVLHGIRTSRKRILRLKRQANLHSARRRPPGEPKLHQNTITTEEPNVMWGTDVTRVFTLEQGWIWAFFCAEHWNAGCVGYHVSKQSTGFAALEPISMAITEACGSAGADVAHKDSRSVWNTAASTYPPITFYTRSATGASPFPLPSSPGQRPMGCRTVHPDLQGAGRLWSSVPQHSGSTRGGGRIRREPQPRVPPGEARIHDSQSSPREPRAGLGLVSVIVCPGSRGRYIASKSFSCTKKLSYSPPH